MRQSVAENSQDTHHVLFLLDNWNYRADRFNQDLRMVVITFQLRISFILALIQELPATR